MVVPEGTVEISDAEESWERRGEEKKMFGGIGGEGWRLGWPENNGLVAELTQTGVAGMMELALTVSRYMVM